MNMTETKENTTIHLFRAKNGVTWQTQYCPYDGLYYGWSIGRNAIKASSMKALERAINSSK